MQAYSVCGFLLAVAASTAVSLIAAAYERWVIAFLFVTSQINWHYRLKTFKNSD